MTNELIIKALECHRKGLKHCNECPLQEPSMNVLCCNAKLLELVTALIRRQQTEIEKLKTEQTKLFDLYMSTKDKLRNARIYENAAHKLAEENYDKYMTARESAIEEFAERAAMKLAENYSDKYCHWIDDTLFNLKKEMAGGAHE